MIVFLTSSPTGPLDGSRPVSGIDEMNGFRENLRRVWPQPAKVLMIAASPDRFKQNDEMTAFFKNALEESGCRVSEIMVWDNRINNGKEKSKTNAEINPGTNPGTDSNTKFNKNPDSEQNEPDLTDFDVIFLGGGHVPAQNAFFTKNHLREKIKEFDGIVVGISAGTMNAADVVYAQPELPGEGVDPSYQKYLVGLNLTKRMILPHYQMVKNYRLDGRRLYEDITFPDSFGREFLVLPDGSYVRIEDGKEEIFGEAWLLKDGVMTGTTTGTTAGMTRLT